MTADQQVRERRLGRWRASSHKLMLILKVAWLARKSPKEVVDGWNSYWAGVTTTGVGGDVLWDSAGSGEFDRYVPFIRQYFDTTLPVIDVGCGSGGFTRAVADHFPQTIGVDVSGAAVALAQEELAGRTDLHFRQLDMTIPGSTDGLAAEFGPANIFIRGVFHVLSPAGRSALAQNLLPVVGKRGRILLAETNYVGGSLGYLASLGATGRRIPEPLERVIRVLAPPGHFGAPERQAAFPDRGWLVLDDGATIITTIPLSAGAEPEQIPGYYAVMAPRSS